MNLVKRLLITPVLFLFINDVKSQDIELRDNYIGLLPSFLAEPYDTIKALEVNIAPFVYERRFGKDNSLGFQLRPMVNYRFYKFQSGISQVGGTVLFNKYFLNLFDEDFWLKPQAGAFYTYTFNQLDRIHTMTFGAELGAYMEISSHWSISLSIQPGINYYPDEFSQDFVETENGFKSHFGVMFHIGYNF